MNVVLRICRGKAKITVKGKGIPFAEHNPAWHHKSKIDDEEIATLLKALGEA